jgi:fumarate reductase subunit D
MTESKQVMAHEISMLISSLGCMLLLMLVLLVLLILLYLLHRISESLQKLHLHCDELLHIGIGWRWWQLLTKLILVVTRT